MTDLVTGATGCLGSHLVEALVERGRRVRALVRQGRSTERLEALGVEVAEGALEDDESLLRAVVGVDRVFHCAALVTDWGEPEAFREANVRGVERLVRASVQANVGRFIHVSTTDVYGYPGVMVDESAPFRARGWLYGDTKIAAEGVVWRCHATTGLPVTVIRPASIYGPRSRSFVMEVVELLRAGRMLHIDGGGAAAGLIYVGNVVDLMLLAADHPVAIGQAYNAADPGARSWYEYVSALADVIGAPRPRRSLPFHVGYLAGWCLEGLYRLFRVRARPLLTRLAVTAFGVPQRFSIDKARAELGFSPAVGFDQGMAAVAEWLRDVGAIRSAQSGISEAVEGNGIGERSSRMSAPLPK